MLGHSIEKKAEFPVDYKYKYVDAINGYITMEYFYKKNAFKFRKVLKKLFEKYHSQKSTVESTQIAFQVLYQAYVEGEKLITEFSERLNRKAADQVYAAKAEKKSSIDDLFKILTIEGSSESLEKSKSNLFDANKLFFDAINKNSGLIIPGSEIFTFLSVLFSYFPEHLQLIDQDIIKLNLDFSWIREKMFFIMKDLFKKDSEKTVKELSNCSCILEMMSFIPDEMKDEVRRIQKSRKITFMEEKEFSKSVSDADITMLMSELKDNNYSLAERSLESSTVNKLRLNSSNRYDYIVEKTPEIAFARIKLMVLFSKLSEFERIQTIRNTLFDSNWSSISDVRLCLGVYSKTHEHQKQFIVRPVQSLDEENASPSVMPLASGGPR